MVKTFEIETVNAYEVCIVFVITLKFSYVRLTFLVL